MINLIICICSLIIGLFILWLKHNLLYNPDWLVKIPNWMRRHLVSIEIILEILQFISFFSFGFFISEIVKYLVGAETIIF